MVEQIEKQILFPPIEDVLSSRGKIKILKVLVCKEEVNISTIVRLTRLNNAAVSQHLAYFKEINMIREKNFGRIKIYQMNQNDLKVQAIRQLIEYWLYAGEGE